MSLYSVDEAAYNSLVQTFVNAPTRVSISTTTATSTVLSVGRYRVISDVPCYIRQGTSAITAATTDNPLPADCIDYLVVTATATNGYVAAITAGPSGTLYLMRQ